MNTHKSITYKYIIQLVELFCFFRLFPLPPKRPYKIKLLKIKQNHINKSCVVYTLHKVERRIMDIKKKVASSFYLLLFTLIFNSVFVLHFKSIHLHTSKCIVHVVETKQAKGNEEMRIHMMCIKSCCFLF